MHICVFTCVCIYTCMRTYIDMVYIYNQIHILTSKVWGPSGQNLLVSLNLTQGLHWLCDLSAVAHMQASRGVLWTSLGNVEAWIQSIAKVVNPLPRLVSHGCDLQEARGASCLKL